MFSFEEYIMGWGIYLFAVIVLLFVFWRMTRFISWPYCRDCVRLFGAVFLLLPTVIDSGSYYWAPAWIKALLNIIFSNFDIFWPIVHLFLLALCSTYLVYFLLSFIASAFNKVRNKQALVKDRREPKVS